MWLKYWLLVLLVMMIGAFTYAYNDPGAGWKLQSIVDSLWSEITSLISEVWAHISGLLQGR